MKNKINYFFGPKDYMNSGINKYSYTYLDKLRKDFIVKEYYVPFKANSILRNLYQLLYLPLKVRIFFRKSLNVFIDESFLLLTLLPFFPYKNSIMIIHDYRDYSLTKKNQSFFEKLYFKLLTKSFENLKYFEKVIVVSKFTKQTLIKEFNLEASKLELLVNSFKIEKKKLNFNKEELFEKYGIKNFKNKKIILAVSSEEERKNVLIILKAIKNLKDVIFIKIGKPIIEENRKKNLSFVKKNKLSNVYFLQDLTEDEINSFYQITDAFTFPTSFEGFGRPAIEAQLNGTPVISSSIEVLKDNLEDSALYLNNEKDDEELTKKIKFLLKDEKLQKKLIKKGYKNCKRFDIERNYKKLFDLLNKF